MPSKLCVWGNSLGVRLPRYVAERTGVQAGDYLFINVTDAGEILIRPVKPCEVHPGYGGPTAGPKDTNAGTSDTGEIDEW
jgi:hypothetical protein